MTLTPELISLLFGIIFYVIFLYISKKSGLAAIGNFLVGITYISLLAGSYSPFPIIASVFGFISKALLSVWFIFFLMVLMMHIQRLYPKEFTVIKNIIANVLAFINKSLSRSSNE
ncbi:MAG: hypothetical protein ACOYT8_06110 [Candidatus Dependentiae bacterium]